MTSLIAPLGMLAFLNLVASACSAAIPANPSLCHGERDIPDEPPAACHAALNCAEHRRVRTNT